MKKFFSYMFEEYLKGIKIRYIGDVMYLELGIGRYAKVEFPEKDKDEQRGPIRFVRISIISNVCGLIDSCDIPFESVFSNESVKYIKSNYNWEGNPSNDDFDNLADNFKSYLELWMD